MSQQCLPRSKRALPSSVSSLERSPGAIKEMQEPDMKSTEQESVPVLENVQENVELPAVAIRENAHPVGRTASASSFFQKY